MNRFDAAIIGGGVMGVSTALVLARSGMRVAIVESGSLCRGASGVNAGTLTLHMVRPSLMPHARRGREMWLDSRSWLGGQITAKRKPGIAVAFNPADEEELAAKAERRNAVGADVRMVTGDEARRIEPALSARVTAAAVSPDDATVVSYEFARLAYAALKAANVTLMERSPVVGVEPIGGGYAVRLAAGRVEATQVVLAGGAWLQSMFAWFGLQLPIIVRINQLTITERAEALLGAVVTVADERLSLKQFPNGTVLVGGGWQGRGDVTTRQAQVVPEILVGNLRLAAWCVPALRDLRLVRTWFGFEAETRDGRPILGAIPGHPGAWAVGAVGSGFTSGPYIGQVVADLVLGREPRAEIFPPDRLLAARAA